MPHFLDRLVLDNPLSSYVWILLLILAMLLLKGIISRFFCGLLYRLFPAAKKYVSRDQFIPLVIIPMEWFIVLLAVVFSLHKLKFPSILQLELYKISTQTVFDALGKLVLIISFIRLLIRFIDFLAIIFETRANQTADQSDNQLVVFFKDFFKAIAVILGVLLVTRFVFHFNIANLITGLSIVTAAIALATRESLENLIASFIIFFDKPFTAGDLVKVENITGTVEKIGLRSTRIRTDQKTYVTMPNKKMVDSILDNLSQRTQRKADIKLEVSTATTAAQLEELLQKTEILLQQQEETENSTVFVSELGMKSITVHVEYFTQTISYNRFNEIKQSIHLHLLRFLNDLKIELAGNKQE